LEKCANAARAIARNPATGHANAIRPIASRKLETSRSQRLDREVSSFGRRRAWSVAGWKTGNKQNWVRDREEERVEVRISEAGVQEEKRKRKRRSPNEAVRLSPRGAFVLRELFKVRRMTMTQVARLCVVSEQSQAPVDLCRRLRALGFITIEDLFADRSKVVISLTEAGRHFAIDRLGRSHRSSIRDDGKDEFTLHSIRGAELYVRLVSGSGTDWVGIQGNADRFEWYSSNESVDFTWRDIDGSYRSTIRKVIPDAVLETAERRFMIEVERSTKTLNAVMAKIENYCHVFSVACTMDKPAYSAKYSDRLAPALVVLLDSDARAANVKELLELRKQKPGYCIPSVFVGGMDDTVAYLRKHVGLSAPFKKADPHAMFHAEVRMYVEHIMNRSGLSSLSWPSNWRTVLRTVYPAAEWIALEPKLQSRIAKAEAREAAKRSSRGAA
jgi:hypothetical protein